MSETPDSPAPVRTITIGDKTLTIVEAEASARSSANWFWWIAALSLANSISTMLELKYGMILGLGITQVIDALLLVTPDGSAQTISVTGRVIHLAMVLGAIGVFFLIGVRARAGSVGAFRFGMIAYALDGVIFLLIADWVGVGFHVFVLFMLWGGYGLAKALNGARSEPAVAVV